MNCDRLAPWYRWLEYGAFGRGLTRRRTAFLDRVGDTQRALLLGDGDGRFAAALLTRQSEMQVVCVERSAGMLRLARRSVAVLHATQRRVQFVQADVRTWLQQRARGDAPASFDLAVTHFFLDCFSDAELPALVAAIAAALTPDARWLVSEFRQPPGRGWRAWHARIWLRVLYGFFRAATGLRVTRLTDHRPLLAAHGFRLEAAQEERSGLLMSELWRRGNLNESASRLDRPWPGLAQQGNALTQK